MGKKQLFDCVILVVQALEKLEEIQSIRLHSEGLIHRRRVWLKRIRKNASRLALTTPVFACSEHFIRGRKSDDINNVPYNLFMFKHVTATINQILELKDVYYKIIF